MRCLNFARRTFTVLPARASRALICALLLTTGVSLTASVSAQIVQVKRPTLMVSNLDASLALYRDILGFTVFYLRGDAPTAETRPAAEVEGEVESSKAYQYFSIDPTRYNYTRFATLNTPSQVRALGLIELHGPPLPRPSPRLSTIVLQVEDVDALGERLRAAGYQVLPAAAEATTPEGVRYKEMPFIDGDGHVIVLYHLRPATPAPPAEETPAAVEETPAAAAEPPAAEPPAAEPPAAE